MRWFAFSFRLATALLCAVLADDASPHGMTPEMQTAITLVLVQKCKDDQPRVAKDIDESFQTWETRNHRAVAALRLYGEGRNKEMQRAIREAYDQNGALTEANCRDLVKALVVVGGQMDVRVDESSRVAVPEVQAAGVIVSAQKCKDDQPQLGQDIDLSFAQWETRNRRYVAALHRDGEDNYRNGLQAFRKSYDEGGRATEAICRDLVRRLQGAESDVVE